MCGIWESLREVRETDLVIGGRWRICYWCEVCVFAESVRGEGMGREVRVVSVVVRGVY